MIYSNKFVVWNQCYNQKIEQQYYPIIAAFISSNIDSNYLYNFQLMLPHIPKFEAQKVKISLYGSITHVN